MDNSTTIQYAGLLHSLTAKARSVVRDIDPQNDLTFLRIRSKKHEIMVAPGKKYVNNFNINKFSKEERFILDKEYMLIVLQNSETNQPILN